MNNYCVPFALGKMSGKSPDEIAALVRVERGRPGRVTGVANYVWEALIAKLGFKINVRVTRPGMTVRKWAANRAKWGDKSTWLVRVSGHLMFYCDNVLYDNHTPAGTKPDLHKYGNSRLKSALQVIPA